jgi:hypothetical protein
MSHRVIIFPPLPVPVCPSRAVTMWARRAAKPEKADTDQEDIPDPFGSKIKKRKVNAHIMMY